MSSTSTTGSALLVKSLENPDEIRETADKGRVALVGLGAVTVGRATFEPGWRWSEHVKALAGTELCEATHTGYVISGHQLVRMADGSEVELKPGDAFVIGSGHDAWVVGDEPCVTLDITGIADYAKGGPR
jgi:quercetin dioxygenase-like cupin family protein